VRLEGLGQLKNSVISSGIEPAAFRRVAYCLNQLRCRVHRFNGVSNSIKVRMNSDLCPLPRIYLVHDRVQWQAHMLAVLNHRIQLPKRRAALSLLTLGNEVQNSSALIGNRNMTMNSVY
jgi:hypothetical protein